jgi:RNA polymerase sigma-70 factor (ECF subfamily)
VSEPPDINEVARRVTTGDESSFRILVAETMPHLLRVAARMLGEIQEAEDVLQESYLRAYQALASGKFDGRSDVTTWLYRIVANRALDVLRARQRRWLRFQSVPVGDERQFMSEAHLALRELNEWLGELPAAHRTALVLKELEGQTTAEIARIMKRSEKAVEQYLVRARGAARQEEA